MSRFSNTHPQEREVYLEASAIEDLSLRSQFLDRMCKGDEHLRSRVDALLEAESRQSAFDPLSGVRELVGKLWANREKDKTSTESSNFDWNPPAPEFLDAHLDEYRIDSIIGRGGMGAVYLAYQSSLERPVALKILPSELGKDSDFTVRFKREALAMAKLVHPNIITIFDFGSIVLEADPVKPSSDETSTSTLYYLVMEYVKGADLRQIITSGSLTPETALQLVGQICDALFYAHSQGYVHRDIKPANIIISETGQVKVGDFGLAKVINSAEMITERSHLTRSGHIIGTSDYLAPELLQPHTTADHRSDIFSLGVMFYEMLTGELPKGAFALPSTKTGGDARVDKVVMKAMQSEPAQRYQQASEVKSDVEKISSSPGKKNAKNRPPFPWPRTLAVSLFPAISLVVVLMMLPNELRPWHSVPAVSQREPDENIVMVTSPSDLPVLDGTLRKAVADAKSGQVVRFDSSLAGQTIKLQASIEISGKEITIDAGDLTAPVRIDGGGKVTVFAVKGSKSDDEVTRLVLENLEIANGRSGVRNGFGEVMIRNCIISDCRITRSGGGGINNHYGKVTVENCLIKGNEARTGGGVWVLGGETVIINSTITENVATANLGGGISIGNNGRLSLIHSTVTNNRAVGSSGGVQCTSGEVHIEMSILAENAVGTDGAADLNGSGRKTMTGVNIVGSNGGNEMSGSPPITLPPKLLPLGDYGGPVPSMPPLPESPAIDAAANYESGLKIDHDTRGFARAIDGNGDGNAVADLGAAEYDPQRDSVSSH